jgi:arsenate reductase (thioredoxin)
MMFLFMLATTLLTADEDIQAMRLNPALHQYANARTAEFGQISKERKASLNNIVLFIRHQSQENQPVRLTFICTHNSRRSHLAQVWAKAAAEFYGVPGVETFSGGTEATAFNPRAVSALQRAGFKITTTQPALPDNSRYQVRFDDHSPPLECFSKIYDEAPNPQTDFCAVLTCSQADAACPSVAGAKLRVSLPYEDPKLFDGTPDESERYDERCGQIAREMLYIFSNVRTR